MDRIQNFSKRNLTRLPRNFNGKPIAKLSFSFLQSRNNKFIYEKTTTLLKNETNTKQLSQHKKNKEAHLDNKQADHAQKRAIIYCLRQ